MGLDNVAVQWPRTGRFYDPVAPAEFVDFAELADAPDVAAPTAALAGHIAKTGTVRATAYTELVDLLLGLEGVLYATDAAAEDEDPVIDPDGCAWIAGGLERFVEGHAAARRPGHLRHASARCCARPLAGGRLADQQLRWLDSRLDGAARRVRRRAAVELRPHRAGRAGRASTAAAPTAASPSTPTSENRSRCRTPAGAPVSAARRDRRQQRLAAGGDQRDDRAARRSADQAPTASPPPAARPVPRRGRGCRRTGRSARPPRRPGSGVPARTRSRSWPRRRRCAASTRSPACALDDRLDGELHGDRLRVRRRAGSARRCRPPRPRTPGRRGWRTPRRSPGRRSTRRPATATAEQGRTGDRHHDRRATGRIDARASDSTRPASLANQP